MSQQHQPAQPPRSAFERPLLAWRPQTGRHATGLLALFALHPSRPELVAGWHQGLSLDLAKARRLWDAHPWEVIDPPPDLLQLLEEGRSPAADHQRAGKAPPHQSG